jgi:hypothetical protein
LRVRLPERRAGFLTTTRRTAPQKGDADMSGIDVHVNDGAAPTFEVVLALSGGRQVVLERDDPELLAIEERCFAQVLASDVGPLPRGAIRVTVSCEADDQRLHVERIAGAVARRILNEAGARC